MSIGASSTCFSSVNNPNCGFCQKEPEEESHFKLCSRCKATRYCSVEHQKADWKVHKLVCRSLNQLNCMQQLIKIQESTATTLTHLHKQLNALQKQPERLQEMQKLKIGEKIFPNPKDQMKLKAFQEAEITFEPILKQHHLTPTQRDEMILSSIPKDLRLSIEQLETYKQAIPLLVATAMVSHPSYNPEKITVQANKMEKAERKLSSLTTERKKSDPQ